ncbi:MAG: phosphohistidine phosphatase SixA [Desulfosalsimonadaceae bacterium]
MALYLVQHGKNLSKEIDPDQGLSEEGLREVARIAKTAADYNVIVGSIEHSGKKRAAQTAEIFAETLGVSTVSATEGLKPLDDVVGKAAAANPGANQMLVGHLPFMERMVAYLTTGSTDYTVFKFQNGGIVCVDKLEDSGLWAIQWALMPHVR